jgi:hypothetical protein
MKKNGLKAGSAKVKIGFPENFFPHKSFRGRYFTGVYEELWVRSLYVSCGGEEALFISVEVGDVSGRWLLDIAGAAGIKKEAVFLTATHTHAAPHADGTWPEDVIDAEKSAEFSALCRKAAIEAAVLSKGRARAAHFSFGVSSCTVNVNRDYKYSGSPDKNAAPYIQASNPEGISDKTVALLSFADKDGLLIGCIANYAVHSNVTFYQTWTYEEGMLVSGDLAGVASGYVEERKGGVALFTIGASADQMPRYLANHRVFDKDGRPSWAYYGQVQGLALADAQGQELGEAILKASENSGAAEDAPRICAADMEITVRGKRDGFPEIEGSENADEYAKNYKEQVPENFRFQETGPLKMNLSLLRIGRVLIIGIPAEIVTSIGLEIKTCVPPGYTAVVITQCNGSFSYISDEFGYKNLTFEATASHCMPGTADRIISGVKALIEQLNLKEETGTS